ncbi:hypothetical protein [Nocardioides sp. Kera G14]|uniref:hypothetical protein n=1 Tax=Nocardioides sp. Kera G14 TaxID=2884264 RepID=UPI001D122498|nr:hypothetical protein [Nocardioides sp. Kera G14]UDY25264.1 hypothetical protein LH076_08255 [Nocardioides sp. Kera G14]
MAARRVSMPKADDLFRPTAAPPAPEEAAPDDRKPSGRVKHDAKMTVYITDDELLEIEQARIGLRRSQGIAVDRGRLVREAVSIVLAELAAKGDKSALVKRLRES